MTSLKKKTLKILFSLQTQGLARSFEDLISSLAQYTDKFWSCKVGRN